MIQLVDSLPKIYPHPKSLSQGGRGTLKSFCFIVVGVKEFGGERAWGRKIFRPYFGFLKTPKI
ncbi:MAG: hypothetical protein EA366_08175 [Spirulina sp. DLM2.Bin59]|nr:MAG: hypothetical protein EA366_08175 [Spirulina sp. DLM2.Bin59]